MKFLQSLPAVESKTLERLAVMDLIVYKKIVMGQGNMNAF